MPSKYKTIKGHAKRRFYERAGVRLDDDLLCRIVASIKKGKAKFIEKQSNRVTKWEVDINGEKRVVIYDKLRHTVVTLLPKDDDFYQKWLAGEKDL